MRIAILTSGILPLPAVQGGAVENLADYYLQYNDRHRLHDITIYSVYDEAVRHHTALSSQVNHYYYIDVRSRWAKIRKAIYHRIHGQEYYDYTIEYFFEQAAKHIRKTAYDAIIIENRPGFALKLKSITNARLIYHIHNKVLHLHTRNAREIFDAATKIITVSKFIANCVQEISPADAKCQHVYNGIDLSHFAPGVEPVNKAKLGFKDDDFILLYSGHIFPEKGISELIDAMIKLKQYSSIKLLVIGGAFVNNGLPAKDDFSKIMAAKATPVIANIVFTGNLPYSEVPRYLKIVDVAVVPSVCDDAFPTTVLEAQAMGLPIISTRRGGIPEEVTPENAILLETDEHLADRLADAILSLYTSPEKKERMGKASALRSRLFDKDNYVENFFKAIQSALTETP